MAAERISSKKIRMMPPGSIFAIARPVPVSESRRKGPRAGPLAPAELPGVYFDRAIALNEGARDAWDWFREAWPEGLIVSAGDRSTETAAVAPTQPPA
jgi:hypothetical protein